MVTIYTQDPCQPCRMTKKEFAKHGIDYQEILVTGNPEAREAVIALGYMQAPVIVTENGHWGGFRPDMIKELAAAKAAAASVLV
jgi:glutaredoxin-like protein NrdH